MTEYQKGARILEAFRRGGVARQKILQAVRDVPIVPDPAESWLDEIPQNQRVSRKDAIRALHWAAMLREAEKFEIGDQLVEIAHARNKAVHDTNRTFRESVESLFGREVTDEELKQILIEHPERESDKKERDEKLKEVRLAIATEPIKAWIATDRTHEISAGCALRFARSTPEYEERMRVNGAEEERLRRDMEIMRATIQAVERKHRGGREI